jgi:hypothetical protein
MKANVTITSRGVITLSVEKYTPERVREFDAAGQELAAWLRPRAPALKRAARPKRKSARAR